MNITSVHDHVEPMFLQLTSLILYPKQKTGRRQKQHKAVNFGNVRMAEWSKAPDSRVHVALLDKSSSSRVFWSTNVGVGSNPTSDNTFSFDK